MPNLDRDEFDEVIRSNNSKGILDKKTYMKVIKGIGKLGLHKTKGPKDKNYLKIDDKHVLIKHYDLTYFDGYEESIRFTLLSDDPDIITKDNILPLSIQGLEKNVMPIVHSPYAIEYTCGGSLNTALHNLAYNCYLEIIHHDAVDKVLNADNKTPLYLLIERLEELKAIGRDFDLNEKELMGWMRKRYPYYDFGRKRIVTLEMLDEIAEVPNAAKFILS